MRTFRQTPSRLTFAHGLMVVAGLLTFVLVAAILQDRQATAEVWVAAEGLSAGSTVDPSQLNVLELTADDPLLQWLVPATEVAPAGRLRNDLAAGAPLLRSDLVPEESSAVGRTYTVPIDSLVLDGLGLRPGDRLDVIGVGADKNVRFVVVDVEVTRLPAAQQSSAFAATAGRSAWVTVQVDEEQALALSQARLNGQLELVRSTGAEALQSRLAS